MGGMPTKAEFGNVRGQASSSEEASLLGSFAISRGANSAVPASYAQPWGAHADHVTQPARLPPAFSTFVAVGSTWIALNPEPCKPYDPLEP